MSKIIEDFYKYSQTNVLQLSESDLDSLIQPAIDHFDISYFARQAYPNDKEKDIARLAFKEHAKIAFKSALICFFIQKKHQFKNISLFAYLRVVISRLASKLAFDELLLKKQNCLICPRCELKNKKIFLLQEGDLFRCYDCSRLLEEKISNISVLKECQTFALHSKTGYECPECYNWMPTSISVNDKIQCPYSNCMFYGPISELKRTIHPFSFKYQRPLSLDNAVADFNDITFLDLLSQPADAENKLLLQENIYDIYDLIIQIIDKQITFLKKQNSQRTLIQKIVSFETFKILLFQFPMEIINLFAFEKIDRNFAVLSRAFQQYVDLMENYLPFSYSFKNETIECVSLNDPNLGLFSGLSTFHAKIKDGSCDNSAESPYVGMRKYDTTKPYFVGKLIDISKIDDTSGKYVSILSNVTEYSFNKICFQDVADNTKILVKHYKIPPHYQMGHLVFIQRTIRTIKDKLHFAINNKKRIPRRKKHEC